MAWRLCSTTCRFRDFVCRRSAESTRLDKGVGSRPRYVGPTANHAQPISSQWSQLGFHLTGINSLTTKLGVLLWLRSFPRTTTGLSSSGLDAAIMRTVASRPLRLLRPLTSPLHAYRHLLRESSYLPPACRPFIDGIIGQRFRLHRNDRPGTASARKLLRKAHQRLRYLRAANAGDMVRMYRILLFAFGRIGPRWQSLMQVLAKPGQAPPVSYESPGPETSKARRHRLRREASAWLDRWDTAKVMELANSQAGQSKMNSPRPKIRWKRLDIAQLVPTLNIWDRPLSNKVAHGKLAREYAKLHARLLPPLPEEEWKLLRTLAAGGGDLKWKAPRRRAGSIQTTPSHSPTWAWERYATEPVRQVDQSSSRRRRSMPGVDSLPGTAHTLTPLGYHRYTSRLWRRLYTGIFQLTPVMRDAIWFPHPGQIEWGADRPTPTKASASHQELFQGVDSNGRLTGTGG
jgi:hypothetical protein